MFIRNCWYVASWSHELALGDLTPVRIAGEPLVLFRDKEGRARALQDRCCHRSAPLSKGRIEPDGEIRCMYHGLTFDAEGICTSIPGQSIIPPGACVQAFPVEERHSWVWVWMGDVALADPGLIPETIGLDDPRCIMRPGRIDYAAHYELINDNLTDFSHLSFVHANSFGATEVWADTRPKVQLLDRGIRVSRWVGGGGAVADDAPESLRSSASADTALFQRYDYLVPGVLIMHSVIVPASARPEDDGPPSEDVMTFMASYSSQAVTPLDENNTRYFFASGPWAQAGEEMADQIFEVVKLAFAEDKDIIEAQQEMLKLKPGRQIATSADAGPIRMRSVIRKLLKAEGNEVAEPTELASSAA